MKTSSEQKIVHCHELHRLQNDIDRLSCNNTLMNESPYAVSREMMRWRETLVTELRRVDEFWADEHTKF